MPKRCISLLVIALYNKMRSRSEKSKADRYQWMGDRIMCGLGNFGGGASD